MSLLFIAFSGLSACKLWTIRPIESKAQHTATTQNFNADAYVKSIWESKIVPTVTEKAVDLTTVLNALDANVDEAKKQFGLRYDKDATHFIVKGEAVIVRVNEESPHRTLTIKPTNYKGKMEVVLQIGPVFRGTALRDAMGFINFNDFNNQLQFAEVSTKLHERVEEKVVRGITPQQGAKISLHSVFSFQDPKKILLTPVTRDWLVGGKF